MAILKIARMGNPVLLQRCEPVPDPGAPEIRRLVQDMMETMEDAPGAGLAAPQVHVPLRLFVFRVLPNRASDAPDDTTVGNTVVINPTVEPAGEERVLRWEGCLSIPGLRAVPRWARIRYSGVDCDGNPVGGEVGGFHAGVVQHQDDHLDGVLYPMRMDDFRLFGFTDDLAKAGGMSAPERSPERDAALDALVATVPFPGWTTAALQGAAGPDADLLFPGGPTDMVETWIDLTDRRMEPALAARLPDRVRAIIALRLLRSAPYKDAVRRGFALLATDPAATARATARTVDTIWHLAGDRSADWSWYSKRAILAGVYGTTLLYWLRDDTDDSEATLAFLDRRLANVGQIGALRRRGETVLQRLRPGAP